MLQEEQTSPPGTELSLFTAAELQDSLMMAGNDLDRLQRLLADATESLLGHFHGASAQLNGLLRKASHHPEVSGEELHAAMAHLAGAITAMQFQDMASQLITHTHWRLRACADRLASEVMGDDEDGTVVVEPPPSRPNPVTQDEMDAGSVELF